MQSFVRTVERGSFADAASGSGLSAAMVGNHVRFLEARLGALLLNRTTRKQSPTELGRAYYLRSRHILDEIEAAEAFADEVQAVRAACSASPLHLRSAPRSCRASLPNTCAFTRKCSSTSCCGIADSICSRMSWTPLSGPARSPTSA